MLVGTGKVLYIKRLLPGSSLVWRNQHESWNQIDLQLNAGFPLLLCMILSVLSNSCDHHFLHLWTTDGEAYFLGGYGAEMTICVVFLAHSRYLLRELVSPVFPGGFWEVCRRNTIHL